MPHCSEPECQREVAVLKNSARKDINLPPTRRTHQAVTASIPNAPASAGRTLESLRPPKPEQILPARSVVAEALFQFHQCSRIILFHALTLYVGGGEIETWLRDCGATCRGMNTLRCPHSHRRRMSSRTRRRFSPGSAHQRPGNAKTSEKSRARAEPMPVSPLQDFGNLTGKLLQRERLRQQAHIRVQHAIVDDRIAGIA